MVFVFVSEAPIQRVNVRFAHAQRREGTNNACYCSSIGCTRFKSSLPLPRHRKALSLPLTGTSPCTVLCCGLQILAPKHIAWSIPRNLGVQLVVVESDREGRVLSMA